MVSISTIHAQESITSTVSFVPLTASAATLGGLPGVFALNLNSPNLTMAFQQSRSIGIKPMRQPPVKHAGKRSPFTVLNFLQIFDDQHLDLREIYLLNRLTQQIFNLDPSVFLAFRKTLNQLVQLSTYILSVREDQSIFVVGIHSNYLTFLLRLRSLLFKKQINKQPTLSHPQPDCLANIPAICQFLIQWLGRREGDNQTLWRAGTCKPNAPVETSTLKRFDVNKVVEQSDYMMAKVWLAFLSLSTLTSNYFTALFSQGLSKSGCSVKPIHSTVDGRQVSQLTPKVLTLPKQVNKVLHNVMTAIEERLQDRSLAFIYMVKKDPIRTDHHSFISLRCHYLVFLIALVAASVFLLTLILGALPTYIQHRSVQGLILSIFATVVSLYLCSIPQSIAKKIKVMEN